MVSWPCGKAVPHGEEWGGGGIKTVHLLSGIGKKGEEEEPEIPQSPSQECLG
jgi:hypothetical protein